MAKKSSTRKSSARGSRKTSSARSAQPHHPACGCGERGQGISINTIIIAVLGLIVLVVLIVIFTGQTGKFSKGTTDVQGGTVCETPFIKLSGTTSSLGGKWQDAACGAGQTEASPTHPADLASHGGMHCCIGAGIPSDAPKTPGNAA